MNFLKKLFDNNSKDIKRYNKILAEINALEPKISALSDSDLQNQTTIFKEQIAQGATYEQILPEVFATVREAGKRVLNMRHFDVQMIGGITLAEGRIAEMKTGEGKTLVATAPVYLHALFGKGVHVITVNDYLAKRDSQWMGRIYRFLGMEVGLCVHGMNSAEKKQAYAADITYGTNNEFGFDYLRDNMAFSQSKMVQRPLYYALVDEVDSILIDEARTPLIISGPADKPTAVYDQVSRIIPRLRNEEDYNLDEKQRTAALTEEGVAKIEQALNIDNLYDDQHNELSHHVNQALKAHTLYKKDRDYVVKDGQVIIVDEFTGRLMFGRRYSEGLHQSIEAKEGVKVERESRTLATITFQNYFRMYERLAGMTGTARTEEDEFRKIYNLDVVEIPTNLPMQRKDEPDIIYRTEAGKYNAVVEDIIKEHQSGRPILVGTVSIAKSEHLAKLLQKRGLPHQVLNAKYHEKEAEIIAQAGHQNAITIATNMAGRGTDIMLGGNPEFMANQEMAKNSEHEYSDQERKDLIESYRSQTQAQYQAVKDLGGLYIIGTERHDSRRIDNQLRGRAGRQGDPGTSRFYISLEDDLVRHFGGESIRNIMDKVGMSDDTAIDSAMVSRSIESAQKRVEERFFDIRKNVLNYDDVMNQQREIIYKERRQALEDKNTHQSVLGMIETSVVSLIEPYATTSAFPEEWDLAALIGEMGPLIPQPLPTEDELKRLTKEEIEQLLKDKAFNHYQQKTEQLGEEIIKQLEHTVILRTVDSKWMAHLDAMDQLRQGIGLRAYGQRDPLIEYRNEAYNMFQEMITEIQYEVSRLCLFAEMVEKPKEHTGTTNRGQNAPAKKQPIRKAEAEKIGRNSPCPCGSGKKYKNCCGAANN